MSVVTSVAALVLTVLLALAAGPKLLDPDSATTNAKHLGISTGLYLLGVGACEGLTVFGLIVGFVR
jgi:hypothetical protein